MVDETEVEMKNISHNRPRRLQKFRHVTINSSRTVHDSILEASVEEEMESSDSDDEESEDDSNQNESEETKRSDPDFERSYRV